MKVMNTVLGLCRLLPLHIYTTHLQFSMHVSNTTPNVNKAIEML